MTTFAPTLHLQNDNIHTKIKAPVNDFTSNVCGETAGSLHYISGITPERAKQVLNIDKGGGNPPLTYFMGVW